MAGCTVQVWGIPNDLPPDRVADKLTIHFLRSRNGGGEISDVQVLPGSPAYALITFEALAGNDWALGRCPSVNPLSSAPVTWECRFSACRGRAGACCFSPHSGPAYPEGEEPRAVHRWEEIPPGGEGAYSEAEP